MKRALAMALGAMLVAGSAVPAAAKSQVDFNGMYRTYMYGVWNPQVTTEKVPGSENKNPDYDSDFFLADRLQLDFGFHATDEVSVYWRLRAPSSQRWGQYDSSSSIMSRFFYGQVKQDWGTLSVGRLKDGFADLGLASLGYAPAGPDVNATGVLPFDIDDPVSGIHYVNRTDGGFQMAAAIMRPTTMQYGYFKRPSDGKWVEGSTVGFHDETSDLFVLEPAYFWDGGGASFGIHYLRDHVQSDTMKAAYKEYSINPAFMQSFGDFAVHFEAKAGFGKAPGEGDQEVKSSGYAAYLDADYNYGPGNVALAGWYAAGPKEKKEGDNKTTGTVGMGGSFAPLIVSYGLNGTPATWYGGTNVIESANENAAFNMTKDAFDEQGNANHWAAALMGAHAFTDDLTFTYALAYLNLLKVDPGYKKNIGYEADLGLQIQLLDNLHLGTTIGYLIAGDALKPGPNQSVFDGSGKKPDDAYSWFTTLTFSF